ncbi:MAG: pyruvate ferredoxin oxidoreductase [Armatimonadota bacterium]|nr:pyruvate ferredoxin oxidoreductase [Armatimonadota bacterium]
MAVTTRERLGLTGNDAVALAWKQIDPDVVAAYPITPSTGIVERFSQYVADGEVGTIFVPVESEHSALSACVGAAIAGARVTTATSSQGLALMHEVLFIAAGLRLPITMAVANRALSAPLNIHGDHSDAMASRDAGWVQLYVRDVQEAYDTTIMAVRIAETARVPVMACLDGFSVSHALEPVQVHDDEAVRAFLGTPVATYPLLNGQPITVGPLALPDAYMEFKRAQAEGMAQALGTVGDVTRAFNQTFGTRVPALLEVAGAPDAETAVLVMGSAADLVADALGRWEAQGRKVALVRLRLYRPFPAEVVRAVLAPYRRVAVLERADSLSTLGGPLMVDTAAALYGAVSPPRLFNRIFGLGGRDLRLEDLEQVAALLLGETDGPPVAYLGVAGDGP